VGREGVEKFSYETVRGGGKKEGEKEVLLRFFTNGQKRGGKGIFNHTSQGERGEKGKGGEKGRSSQALAHVGEFNPTPSLAKEGKKKKKKLCYLTEGKE